jgi:hypothetical protein
MTDRTLWDPEELQAAKTMREKGMKYAEIGRAFGRSGPAAYKAIQRAYGISENNSRAEYWNGPAIGVTLECTRLKKDAEQGTAALGEACLDYFCRVANKVGRSLDDVLEDYKNGKPASTPGTEQPYISANAFGMAA